MLRADDGMPVAADLLIDWGMSPDRAQVLCACAHVSIPASDTRPMRVWPQDRELMERWGWDVRTDPRLFSDTLHWVTSGT